MKYILMMVLCLSTNVTFCQSADTISVLFEMDLSTSEFTKQTLKSFDWSKVAQVKAINGYTDGVGNEDYNQNLSNQRAQHVKDQIEMLTNKSMSIKPNGYGESQSVNDVDNAQMRRVDIIVQYEEEEKKIMDDKTLINPELPEDQSIIEIADSDTNIVLEGVNFIGGQHYPLPESRPAIEKLVRTMQRNPNLRIEIQGYICCEYDQFDGMDFHTQTMNLSENRAKYLYEYLIDKGIAPHRLQYKGYGSSKPLVFPEVTEEDRIINRRVEIKILN